MDRPTCSIMTANDGYIWNKYQIGEWLNVIDPVTGKPAERNICNSSKNSPEQLTGSTDPDVENSPYQDRACRHCNGEAPSF